MLPVPAQADQTHMLLKMPGMQRPVLTVWKNAVGNDLFSVESGYQFFC